MGLLEDQQITWFVQPSYLVRALLSPQLASEPGTLALDLSEYENDGAFMPA